MATNSEKWVKLGESGEKLEKVGKVESGKSGDSSEKWGKVLKSGLEKVRKSAEKV